MGAGVQGGVQRAAWKGCRVLDTGVGCRKGAGRVQKGFSVQAGVCGGVQGSVQVG